jgi:redox-sensitive bicupin YhaK (pirin superfamily)
MTAGSGLVHSEMTEKEFAKNGGRLHGFQLWINLRKIDK